MDAFTEPVTDSTQDAAAAEPPGAAREDHAETAAVTADRRMIAVSDASAVTHAVVHQGTRSMAAMRSVSPDLASSLAT